MVEEFSLKDIVNVGPVEKRRGLSWKTVYQFLSGLSAEYAVSKGADQESDVRSFIRLFVEGGAERAFKQLTDIDIMDPLLDRLDFQETSGSYGSLSTRLTLSGSADGWKVSIDGLSFDISGSYLRLVSYHGLWYAQVRSEASEHPVYISIRGKDADLPPDSPAPVLSEDSGKDADGIRTVPEEEFFQIGFMQPMDGSQRSAITAPADHDILVLASAGSGKTRVLTARMCYLNNVIGIPIPRMIALTYSKRASGSMRDTVRELFNSTGARRGPRPRPAVDTIDAFFQHFMSDNWQILGFTRKPVYNLDSDGNAKRVSVLRSAMDRAGYVYNGSDYSSLFDKLEKCANGLNVVDPGIDRLLEAFIDIQVENNEMLDFYCVAYVLERAFEKDEAVNAVSSQYSHIIIDEFQDISKLQNGVFSRLYGKGVHFTIAGDDNQTIYTWRGSDTSIIRNMHQDHGFDVIRLTINYRCNPFIVEAGNDILGNLCSSSGQGTRVVSNQDNGERIRVVHVQPDFSDMANEIRKLYGPGKDDERICVLSRSNRPFKEVQNALTGAGVRFNVRSSSSIDTDQSWGYKVFKALVHIRSGETVKGNFDFLNELTGNRCSNIRLRQYLDQESVYQDDGSDDDGPDHPSLGDVIALAKYVDTRFYPAYSMDDLINNYNRGYAEMIEGDLRNDRAVKDQWLVAFQEFVSERSYPYPLKVDLLDSIFDGFEARCSRKTVQEVSGDDVNRVTISTIHSAKGLEFDTVFIVGLNDGEFPRVVDDSIIGDLEKLKQSKQRLNDLRGSITGDVIDGLIDQCGSSQLDTESADAFREGVEDIADDLGSLTYDAVMDYIDLYGDVVSPQVETLRNSVRDRTLELNARISDSDKLEERRLKGQEVPVDELESVAAEVSAAEVARSDAEARLSRFEESISGINRFEHICETARGYFRDLERYDRRQEIIEAQRRFNEEKAEEEKRLFYVAVTRARKLLYLCTTEGETPSPFIYYVNRRNRVDYHINTTEEDRLEEMRNYRLFIKNETAKSHPDMDSIDRSTRELIESSPEEERKEMEKDVEEYISGNKVLSNLGRISPVSDDYLRQARSIDFLGRRYGMDMSSAVILDIARSAEDFLRSGLKDPRKPFVVTDRDTALKIYELVNNRRGRLGDGGRVRDVEKIPSRSYFVELLTGCDSEGNAIGRTDTGEKLNLKELAIELFSVYSAESPLSKNGSYRSRLRYKDIEKKGPGVILLKGLDIANMRNKAVHEDPDLEWNTDSRPYAFECLKEIAGVFILNNDQT